MEKDLDRLIESREANPEDLQDFRFPMVLFGSDVTSLYPSLDADKVATLIYNAIMKTDIKWSHIDFMEAVRYIALNWTEEQCKKSSLRRVLPTKRGTRGTRPS